MSAVTAPPKKRAAAAPAVKVGPAKKVKGKEQVDEAGKIPAVRHGKQSAKRQARHKEKALVCHKCGKGTDKSKSSQQHLQSLPSGQVSKCSGCGHNFCKKHFDVSDKTRCMEVRGMNAAFYGHLVQAAPRACLPSARPCAGTSSGL